MTFGANTLTLETGTRGIAPKLLLEQVVNTASFALDPGFHPGLPYLDVLRRERETPSTEIGPVPYFRLSVSAHFTTVATYVPTDVDNQIRFKLWDPTLAVEPILEMADWVEQA